jgi:hypothetical protein
MPERLSPFPVIVEVTYSERGLHQQRRYNCPDIMNAMVRVAKEQGKPRVKQLRILSEIYCWSCLDDMKLIYEANGDAPSNSTTPARSLG